MKLILKKIKHLKLDLEDLIRWFIPLYVFLLPWQARYIVHKYSSGFPFYGDLSMYVTDFLFIFIFTLWVIWLLRSKKFSIKLFKKVPRVHKIIAVIVLLLILYSGISIFWSLNHAVAFWKWMRIVQGVAFILVLITFPFRIRSVFLAIIAAAMLQGLLAVDQFVLQKIGASTFWGMSEQKAGDLGVSVIDYAHGRWLRAYGSFPHPNILGAFLAIAAIAASAWYYSVYMSLEPLLKKWRRLTLGKVQPYRLQIAASLSAFVILILGLLLSFSRTSWLGFASGWVALTLVLLIRTKKKKRFLVGIAAVKLVLAGVLMLAILTMLNGPMWTQRASGQSRLAAVSKAERSLLFKQAGEIVSLSPVVGNGIGSYIPQSMKMWPNREIYEYQPVHNVWVLMWAELGSLGLAVFALWLAFLLYWFRRLLDKKKAALDLDQEVIFACLIAMGIMAYFEHFWWTLPAGILFASLWLGLYFKKQSQLR